MAIANKFYFLANEWNYYWNILHIFLLTVENIKFQFCIYSFSKFIIYLFFHFAISTLEFYFLLFMKTQWCNLFFNISFSVRHLTIWILIADKMRYMQRIIRERYAGVCLQPPYTHSWKKLRAVSGTIFDIDTLYFHHTGAGFALLFVGILQFRMRFVHRSETMPAALSNIAWPADSILFQFFFPCCSTHYSCFSTVLCQLFLCL